MYKRQTLYVTSDGGVTFTQMEFPMEEVTELPDIADELGYTIGDYDYAEMPQVSDGQRTVIIKAEYSSYGGLRFTSVSYTHLDVYKRQGCLNFICDIRWRSYFYTDGISNGRGYGTAGYC